MQQVSIEAGYAYRVGSGGVNCYMHKVLSAGAVWS
ncbi:hypothetical protein H4S14_001319 [Agrobacterium vitis]|nr:hypothetical protein [Agrobacterium vitis]MBE1437581.1 hypothetical protein [Agrobacterium vitis]